MEKDLTGSVAFVTGSGRGLGRFVAERLAERGADIIVHDIDQKAPAEFGEAESLDAVAEAIGKTHGVRALAVVGDVADEAAVRAMAERAEAALGPINILVNCAGGDIAAAGGKPQPNNALGIRIEDVRALLDRNLVGTILVCQAVCPGMVRRRRGSVVNIASVAAHTGEFPQGIVYGVAKAGVAHWTRCLAQEVRADGVRVNCVSPGATKTARFLATRPVKAEMMDESVPLDRYATPEEIADVVAFLAGDGARFVSGQILRVDGGKQLFPA